MKKQLSLATCIGAMEILLSANVADVSETLGVTPKQWDLVTDPKPWQGADRLQVENTLKALLNATIDRLSLPRFELPAEYISAGIALFVHPINYQAACAWIGAGSKGAETLANFEGVTEPIEGFEKVTAQQCFAIICMIVSGEEIEILSETFAEKSEKKLGYMKFKKNA